ncbi:hypothetical protein PAECIP112173_02348 [Paenibacillus sp. JJ-100]|uniref:hypothetical protein n=1 Tax=Paenibacillus sp. JJ-100 TaxID=2974896 RepID=UPI0022FF9F88|nr:hypothetical protein [Paenibacillus sp. JJ-100]CAI6074870.1 hypothetical protein PAECIP112173_02348 [Paenibacillus sp. JJ-100]
MRKLIDSHHQTHLSYVVRGDDGRKLAEVFVIRRDMLPARQRRKQRAGGVRRT